MEILILFLFFFSGVCGLVYEIIWIKLFSLSFGNTVFAISAVLAAFMLGLSAGGLIFGKIADRVGRDIKTFAFMEVGIGVSALAILFLFPGLDSAYVFLHHKLSLSPEGSTLLRFLAALLVLFVPTMLMGGTVPVLGRCLVDRLNMAGSKISRLYGINTLGACFGCLFSGYFLIPTFGLKASIYLTVAINFSIAGVAYYFINEFLKFSYSGESGEGPLTKLTNKSKKEKGKSKKAEAKNQAKAEAKDKAEVEEETETICGGTEILIFSLLAGFCGLAYEVLWTRAFAIIFKSTIYLFSNILAIFLLGIAIGSLCYKRFFDRLGAPVRLFGLTQIGIGCFGLLSILIFWWMPGEAGEGGRWIGANSWKAHVCKLFGLNLLVAFIPAFLMGLAFPLLIKAYINSLKQVGHGTGKVYSFNVIGGILGSIAAGFLFIPITGLQTGILLVAICNIGMGVFAVFKSGPGDGFGWSGFSLAAVSLFLLFAIIIPGPDIGEGPGMDGEVIFKKEGVAGTVKVIKEKKGKALTLSVNNYRLATSGDVAVRFGHIPLLFHPSPRDVLLISLGAGITAGAVGTHDEVERIDCVEIVPELVEAAGFFKESNHGVLTNPKLHLTIWDGRNFIRTSQRKFDVIISDLFQPDSSGVGNLYAMEHYQACLKKLKEAGLMAQWLPLYQLHPDDLKTIIATFSSVFPSTTLWFGDTNAAKPTLLLLGSVKEMTVSPEEIMKRTLAGPIKKDLIEWYDPFSFLSFYITGGDGIANFVKNAKINMDNHPVIEYSSPRHVWSRPKDAVINFTELEGIRTVFKQWPPGLNTEELKGLEEKSRKYFKSRGLLLKGRIAHARGDINQEVNYYKKSELENPSDPYLGFSYFELGYLYLSQARAKEALWFLEKAVSISPRLPEAHFFLAKVYQQMGETAKAGREYKLAREAL